MTEIIYGLGQYTLVNTVQTVGDQKAPTITTLKDGSWVVTWMSQDVNGFYDIYQQRFDSSGQPLGEQAFPVNFQVEDDQSFPTIAALEDGGWVVVWMSRDANTGSSLQASPTTMDWNIYQQRYDADGNAVGTSQFVPVNTYTTDTQSNPSVSGLADGGWIVTWQSYNGTTNGYDIIQQRYNKDGAPIGTQSTSVNTAAADNQTNSKVTGLSTGGWAVVWDSKDGGTDLNTYVRVFNPKTKTSYPAVKIPGITGSSEGSPSIAALKGGKFVVTWQSDKGLDTSGNGIYLKIFTDTGSEVTTIDILVNETIAGEQTQSSVTMLADGSFLVVWTSTDQGGSTHAYQRHFSADGVALSGEAEVGKGQGYSQSMPKVTALPANPEDPSDVTWIITWEAAHEDGSGLGVYQQKYTATSSNVFKGSADTDAIAGTSAADTIDGGGSDDIMAGSTGNDTYYVDNVGDVVVELKGEGFDTVIASVDYSLEWSGYVEVLKAADDVVGITLTGNAQSNTIIGSSGDDVLDGGVGGTLGDRLYGGAGNDVYYLRHTSDVVEDTEGASDKAYLASDVYGNDSDLIAITVADLHSKGIEQVYLDGELVSIGNDGGNPGITLTGGAGNDPLAGGSGDDTINGGAGDDTMAGGAGDDVYHIHDAGDVIVEDMDPSVGGFDIAYVHTGSYDLADDVGLEVLWAAADVTSGVHLIGNNYANMIIGSKFNDTLDGGNGSVQHTLQGGAGNDTYYLRNINDVVVDSSGSSDSAYLYSSVYGNNPLLIKAIVSHLHYKGIESVYLDGVYVDPGDAGIFGTVLTGGDADEELDGNIGNDTIDGGGGADIVGGAAGNDVLYGGSGWDTLNGGAGNDTLYGGADYDTMVGGAGDDIYHIEDLDDVIQEGMDPIIGGFDVAYVSTKIYGLAHNVGVEVLRVADDVAFGVYLYGNNYSNLLIGGLYDDTLDGGDDSAQHTLIGGDGNDTYILRNINDVVLQDSGGNFDKAYLTSGVYFGDQAKIDAVIADLHSKGIEQVYLDGVVVSQSGNDGDDSVSGGAEDDSIDGGTGNDTIAGNNGNDTIDGGAGDDTLLGGAGDDSIDGGTGDDTISGGSGKDTLDGGDGNDTMDGGADHDSIGGGAGDDSMSGGSGNDTIDGGAGNDTMDGGAGNDIYHIHDAGDVIVEDMDPGVGGIDVAYVHTASYDLADGVGLEELRAADDVAFGVHLIGNNYANLIVGSGYNDTLDGGSSDAHHTLQGGEGSDVYILRHIDDVVKQDSGGTLDRAYLTSSVYNNDQATIDGVIADLHSKGIEWIYLDGDLVSIGGGGNPGTTVPGSEGDDSLPGGDGDDTIDGGTGNDTMDGGAGNDVYHIHDAGDVIVEDMDPGVGGIDVAYVHTASYDLADGVGLEVLRAANDIAFGVHLVGNNYANLIIGNGYDDTLDGGNGSVQHTLQGGAGNDAYYLRNINDVVVDSSGSADEAHLDSAVYGNDQILIKATIADLRNKGIELVYLDGTLVETGGTPGTTVPGGEGDDSLPGGDGDDTIIGGGGNDTLIGGGGNDTLDGGTGTDTLDGGTGNDTLDGGTGNDTMDGGAGDDIYHIHDAGDVIVEDMDPGVGGIDVAYVHTGSYDLADDVGLEVLRAADDIAFGVHLVGNNYANLIIGNVYNDTLDGGNGNVQHTLQGGAGNDAYYLRNINDVVVDSSGSADEAHLDSTVYGNDEILIKATIADLRNKGIELVYLDGTLVETGGNPGTTVPGGDGDDSLPGGDGDDTIIGGGGNDTLIGGGGNDTLDGGTGDDTMDGGAGDDIYHIYDAGDVIVEDMDPSVGGIDIAYVHTGSYDLADDVGLEVLRAAGDVASGVHLVGNNYANLIIGGAFDDTLDGGNGSVQHTLQGGAGNDTYFLRHIDDVVLADADGAADKAHLMSSVYNSDQAVIDGVIADLHSKGIEQIYLDGILVSTSGNGGGNNAPTVAFDGIFAAENSPSSYPVGTFTFQDQDGDQLTYTLVDDAGGRFKLDTATNQLKVNKGYLLDYEQQKTHSITIEVNDGKGGITTATYVIEVRNKYLDYVTGDSDANKFVGGGANDRLSGMGGDDTLLGGAGNDTLIGGTGADVFQFNQAPNAAHADKINDFSVSDGDRICLIKNPVVYKELAVGALSAGAFHIGAQATSAEHRVLYDSATGSLYYDADGTGSGTAKLIATLSTGLALTSEQFFVI